MAALWNSHVEFDIHSFSWPYLKLKYWYSSLLAAQARYFKINQPESYGLLSFEKGTRSYCSHYSNSLEIQTWAISKDQHFLTVPIRLSILKSRLIGPPEDWAQSQWFIQGSEETIYGKLFKNNMDGLSSFYPVLEGIDYLVNSDSEVALFQFTSSIHSFKQYQCKVCK